MEEQKKLRIVLVDDDDFLVQMYSTKFAASGVEVEACKSGEVLLEKLNAGLKPDLIFLDIVMPGLTGIQILQEMRKHNLAEGVPVVMLTNQNDEKDITGTKALGVAGYIVKSALTPSEVVAEAMKIINSK